MREACVPQKSTSSSIHLVLNVASQKKYAEAERLLRKALEIEMKIYGRDHPEVATSLNNLAAVLEEQVSSCRTSVS